MKKRTASPHRTRYFAGERVIVRSHQGTAACSSIPCDGTMEFATEIVAFGPGASPGSEQPDPNGRYLVLSGGNYAKQLTASSCLNEGPFANFNVGHQYLGQLVVVVGAAAVLREAPPAVNSLAADQIPGLFCAGPCKNFHPNAAVESDPKANGYILKWWCRSCRQDSGWMRD